MTISSPFAQIKTASLKIMNERRIFKSMPSEKLTVGDLLLDKSNREEMIISHKFIEAYTTEYRYTKGLQKDNYARVYTNYGGSLDNFSVEDLEIVYNTGFMKKNPFFTGEGWADPDSKKIDPTLEPKKHKEYMSWMAEPENETFQYFTKNEEIILSGIQYLVPRVEVGVSDSYIGTVTKYTPFSAQPKPETTTTTSRDGGEEETTAPLIEFDMACSGFSEGDFVMFYTEDQRPDLLDKSCITIKTGCNEDGNLQITIRETGPISVAVSAASNKTPESVAAAIRSTTFPEWTTGGFGTTVVFTSTKAGSKVGAVTLPETLGVTVDIKVGIATTAGKDYILDSKYKGNRVLAKVSTGGAATPASSETVAERETGTGRD